MKSVTMASLLLLSAVCAMPASANFFFNRPSGTTSNVGSAPNPTPAQLRAIGDAPYPAARRGGRAAAIAQASQFYAGLSGRPSVLTLEPVVIAIEAPALTTSTKTGAMTKTAVRHERRATSALNRASLTHARTLAAKATAAKPKTVAATKAAASKTQAVAAKMPRS